MSSRVVDLHRTRISQIESEAAALAGALQKIADTAQEVLTRGGQLQVQPQVAFITGGIARMLKDLGVVEQLQGDGISARSLPRR